MERTGEDDPDDAGATFDAAGALTNRAALIRAFATKIQDFGCNYLASRANPADAAKTGVTVATVKAAAKNHLVSSSEEVSEAFVDALAESVQTGAKIEAKRFPPPKPGGRSACGVQMTLAPLLGL